VERVWKALSPQERATSALPWQASELLNWAQATVAADRNLTAAHLEAIQKAGRYRSESPRPRSRAVQVRA
jgi:hypothetical protein